MSSVIEPPRLVWLANRLRCMSVAEVGYRIRQALGVWPMRRRVLHTPYAQIDSLPEGAGLMRPALAGMDPQPYVREADAILAGEVPLFAALRAQVGPVPDWNRNPQALCRPPAESGRAPGKDDAGDVRYLWELNRHYHWVRLAQAYALSGEVRFRDGLAAQLRAWLDACPPLSGPNWTSSLELAIRLVNWSAVWQLTGGREGALFGDEKGVKGGELCRRWLASIDAHCRFIRQRLSRHSSANNHLIGELTGLYVAARTWPFARDAAAWAAQAKAELEREAVKQHFPDGGNREQAFAYQAFSCECLLTAGLCGARGNDAFAREYWLVLERALRFLRSMRDAGGNFPLVGDGDDGALLRLEPRSRAPRPSTVLVLGAAAFGGQASLPANDSVRWLIGDERDGGDSDHKPRIAPAAMREPATDWRFPDSGYFLFGEDFGTPNEIKGGVDCGPLGYLAIAAHGHADALAVWLSVAGEACLVDAGTYSYGDAYRWRDYFRGTSAHNTVRVDGKDQSVSGGRFMWLRKARVTVNQVPRSPEHFEFAGGHDGYLRLRDPVRHLRSVAYDAALRRLVVTDTVAGKAPHEVEQFWHFAPGMRVALAGGQVEVAGTRFKLRMNIAGAGLTLDILRGHGHAEGREPPLGWYSAGYGLMEPTCTLRVRTLSAAASIRTCFDIERLG